MQWSTNIYSLHHLITSLGRRNYHLYFIDAETDIKLVVQGHIASAASVPASDPGRLAPKPCTWLLWHSASPSPAERFLFAHLAHASFLNAVVPSCILKSGEGARLKSAYKYLITNLIHIMKKKHPGSTLCSCGCRGEQEPWWRS